MAVTHQPLRIAHVITRLINGGADENTVISCNEAVRRGHSVMLVHGAETRTEILAAVDPRVEIVGLPSLVQPIAPLSDMRALRGLVATFRRHRPDVVHTHTSKAGILGRLAARATRVPVLVHGVHIVPFDNVGRLERRAYLTAERSVQRMTHAFIDVSPAMRDLCVQAGVGSPERHHLVPSGFDLSLFRKATKPEDWRDLLRLRPDDPRPPLVVMLAVFEPRKRHLECLETFPSIVARFPEARFVFAGDGRLRGEIEARIRTLGIESECRTDGFPSASRAADCARGCVPACFRARGAAARADAVSGGRKARGRGGPALHRRCAARWRERARHRIRSGGLRRCGHHASRRSRPTRSASLEARRQPTSRTGTRGAWASAWRPSTRM